MTVEELIYRLEKVKEKDAIVYVGNSERSDNVVDRAIIEHDLFDDEIVVVLKT